MGGFDNAVWKISQIWTALFIKKEKKSISSKNNLDGDVVPSSGGSGNCKLSLLYIPFLPVIYSCSQQILNEDLLYIRLVLGMNKLRTVSFLKISQGWKTESQSITIHTYTHCVCLRALSHFSRVWLFVTLWTVACQAPLSMGILQARMLEWVAIPFPEDLLDPEIEPISWGSCIGGRFFTADPPGRPMIHYIYK